MNEQEAMDAALSYLREEVRPRANLIDRDPDALKAALQGLCSRGLMALKRPEAFGGPAVSEPAFRRFQEESARTSGSLCFLQTQHQSAVSIIAGCDHDDLKSEYLPLMADGRKTVGIGFSQLRRSGPPIMTAEACEEGYIFRGTVPWVTGWSYFQECLVGAALPAGQAVFALTPIPMEPGPEIACSPPMKLAAMETANTVSMEFSGYLVPHSKVVTVRPVGWIANSDMINIALQGHFAIGCALAGLDVLRDNAQKKPFPFLGERLSDLESELEACRSATALAQQSTSDETTQDRLKVRAWAIDLAVRCAHAAITSSSGAANSIDHPAQRIYREALVYTVSAQTPAIMDATLARLVR